MPSTTRSHEFSAGDEHLLGTNTCSAFLRKPSTLANRFVQHCGRLSISTVSLGELYTWAYRRPDPTPLIAAIQTQLLREVDTVDFDADCARRFGKVRAVLLSAGRSIDPPDLMIAAVSLVNDLTVVTHNTRHFEPVPDLRVED